MRWGAADLSASFHRNETVITANRNPASVRETQTMLITENQPKQRIGAALDVRSVWGIGARSRLNHGGSVKLPPGHAAQLWAFDYPAESSYGLSGLVTSAWADLAIW